MNQKYALVTKDQFKKYTSNRLLNTINNNIIINRIRALFARNFLGSGLFKIFLSNFVTNVATPLAMSSPTDLNASKVMGIPSNETQMQSN